MKENISGNFAQIIGNSGIDYGTGTPTSPDRVADAATCGDNAWYIDGGGEIARCPSTCTTVASDAAAAVRVLTGCANGGVGGID